MKHRVCLYSTALLMSAIPFVTLSCKKEEPVGPAGEAAAAGGGDTVLSAPAWGYAARLPKDIESFVALYRAGELVEAFKNSNFFRKAKSNPVLAQQLNLDQLEQMAESPEAKEAMALASEIAGKEVVISLSAGFTDNAVRIVKSLIPLARIGMQKSMQDRFKGGADPSAAISEASAWDKLLEQDPAAAAAAMVEGLIDSDIPPFCIAVNAGGAREKITGHLQQAMEALPPEARAKLDAGSFTVGGKYEFQSLTFAFAKALPPEALPAVKEKIGQLVKDPVKGASLTDKLLAKTAEISWGWVDNYLVLALGKDHSHVKLAGLTDGVFSLPEVSARALKCQPKKPNFMAFSSQKMNRSVAEAMSGMGEMLFSLVQAAGGQSPFPLDGIVADLKKLAARAQQLFPSEPSASIAAAWWDGGLNAEMFGGAKPGAFDASKPLTFGSLAGPTTVFLSESRVNEAFRDKAFGFIEESAITLWDSFQKNVKPAMPDDMKQSLALGEPVALPLLKSLWKSVQDFRAAMGSESALLVNLDGAMPALPDVPPELKTVKIPRILVVSDLKDRAKLTESWAGLGSLIGNIVTMTQAPVNPQPVEKKEGDVTLWGFELPMDTGDVWPHTAAAGNHWDMGTSPSLTKEAAAKTPAPSGPPAGAHVRINFDAVWNYAASVIPLAPNLPEQKKNMTDILDLARALNEIDARTGEEKGDSHCTLFIGITDVK